MGLFANEKSTGTMELLMTSPVSIWEIVVGKYLAALGFALLMVVIVAFFPGLLFFFGEPDVGKTAAALLGQTRDVVVLRGAPNGLVGVLATAEATV